MKILVAALSLVLFGCSGSSQLPCAGTGCVFVSAPASATALAQHAWAFYGAQIPGPHEALMPDLAQVRWIAAGDCVNASWAFVAPDDGSCVGGDTVMDNDQIQGIYVMVAGVNSGLWEHELLHAYLSASRLAPDGDRTHSGPEWAPGWGMWKGRPVNLSDAAAVDGLPLR